MKSKHPEFLVMTLSSLLLTSAVLTAQTVVYSENFDGVPVDMLTNTANIQLGGKTKPTNARYALFNQWGFNPIGNIINIGGGNGQVLQPRSNALQNGRSVGAFLNPTLFAATGPGTYTLTFDVIPSATGVGRVYVGSGSGYDLSLTNDGSLSLNLTSDGFGIRRTDGTLVWPALTASGGATARHLITTRTEWIDALDNPTGQFRDVPGAPIDVRNAATLSVNFEYDGTSALVIAFGAYESDYKVDNITITTAVPPSSTWAGYPIMEGGYVDTGSFMGLLWVTDLADFVYSVDLGRFIYLPEAFVTSSGAWVHVPR